LDLLKDNGYLGYIVPNNWVSNAGASILRNKILMESKIEQLIDFEDYMVFQNASIQTMIVILSKNSAIDNYRFFYQKFKGKKLTLPDVKSNLINKASTNISVVENPIIVKDKLKDKFFKFNESSLDVILDGIKQRANFTLDKKKEVAQGIVGPQDSLNKSGALALSNRFKIGTGIFNLTNEEYKRLGLSKEEQKLIKPLYTTEQLSRYYGNPKNNLRIIYTDSSFKKPESIKPYPNIKRHLDQFRDIITSDNFPYGLHRSREESFFKGQKIISLRKCESPTFTYTAFDCYVSQTFYVIKTERANMKYLTALFNSSLIKFWLLKRGKMQGSQFQVDKEPILEIPIFIPTEKQQEKIEKNVNKIIELKDEINSAKTESDKSFYERQINGFEVEIDDLIYELYNIPETDQLIIENILEKI
jgi:adenine-specific DNA-methyltransferase